jgi:hypothetical protein
LSKTANGGDAPKAPDPELVRDWVERTRAAQGLPAKVTDPVIIRRRDNVASLAKAGANAQDSPETSDECAESGSGDITVTEPLGRPRDGRWVLARDENVV